MSGPYRCLVHGPSPAVLVNDQRECGRCVKRPPKIAGKRVQFKIDEENPNPNESKAETKTTEKAPSVDLKPKKQDTAILKGIRSAYLQIVVVPAKPSKTEGELEKKRLKKQKRQDEVDAINKGRESLIKEICKSYELPMPYNYSMFVSRPKWIDDRREDMAEYLHNVQAVLQSFERHDKVDDLSTMKERENKLYRTTKKSAFRVLYINEATPLMLEFLPDQHASAAYRDFLQKVHTLTGAQPPVTAEDDCSPYYTTQPRTTGPQRRFSINTYRADKYALKSYRHQRNHKYSVPYMVKGTVRLNQMVYPRYNGKKNLTIMKHLRTVMILRKLFYHHNAEFQNVFKQQLVDHAIDLQDYKINAKWNEFLNSGNPPEKIKDLLKMTNFVSPDTKGSDLAEYCVWDDPSKGPECLYLPKPKDENENSVNSKETAASSKPSED